ncbi:hypothetical protein SD446_02435 [Bordetella hinzii]|uniref:hypothetical protein n=1 Tax=Bordetella hinzii TaxID=103855 RepID=UPI002A189096|nr:hypothetical protein [Bordetella hinzii]WPL81619.1 hypothetical protein SD446_02435 [Bordetella hinzii]
MEPGTTGIESWMALKLALAIGLPAVFAVIVGMLIMPPRTAWECFARTVCTVVSALVFAPVLAIALLSWRPALADAVLWLAHRTGPGEEPLFSLFYVLGPCMLLTGLPAWWVLGAYMRWMARMREQGILAWADDLRRFRQRRGGKEG